MIRWIEYLLCETNFLGAFFDIRTSVDRIWGMVISFRKSAFFDSITAGRISTRFIIDMLQLKAIPNS
jgi:hypothetical protein